MMSVRRLLVILVFLPWTINAQELEADAPLADNIPAQSSPTPIENVLPTSEDMPKEGFRESVYPDIPAFFVPKTVIYQIYNGQTNDLLQTPEAQSLMQNLTTYAKYYQAPWYFLNFTQILGERHPFKVRYFTKQEDFQSALVALSGDESFHQRTDFITVQEADGEVVLYLYGVTNPLRREQLLRRQGFIQFATIAMPTLPMLLRDGFSLYFEDIHLHIDIRQIIRNRTFYKNITSVPALYTLSTDERGEEYYTFSDDARYAWLLIHYLYSAYSLEKDALPDVSWEFQYLLTELEYIVPEEETLLAVIQANNALLAERLDGFFAQDIQIVLREHLGNTKNHHQAYLAGMQLFEQEDFIGARKLFLEAAFSLEEYYQPRYAIARIALYDLASLRTQEQALREELESFVDPKPAELQSKLEALEEQIARQTLEARYYLNEAKILIEHHLKYGDISDTVRQEMEEFHARILRFYETDATLSPESAYGAMPSGDEGSDRY
ncbi:hypothetical protein [Entomospira culicis]|uniref:Tetratricopeptide repeat protein n=1 Tax=Entomospira culicis TaxID=2719989 RepID=A0A968GEW6_9SPIO|nr:hypothetical protein [Entomospira culicis]NIZ18542.1 hypothetical protein [Entomospira culicis]NIZ68758.1 hypothetical protein [Entomospira culicis]WDI37354.1 hypothetical protein PVA46_00775 [Entomospira culicis]WDI38983.1 hypothetical protein PVA47_00785 [Entomospira culicis]